MRYCFSNGKYMTVKETTKLIGDIVATIVFPIGVVVMFLTENAGVTEIQKWFMVVVTLFSMYKTTEDIAWVKKNIDKRIEKENN